MCRKRPACWALSVVALALLALVFLSCASDGSGDEASASNPTGVAELDAIISAVERQDLETLVELVRYQQIPCRPGTEDDYIVPPGCPEARPQGTPVEVFMSGGCHPRWVRPDGVRDAIQWDNRFVAYAVFQIEEPFETIAADHRVVLGRPGRPDESLSAQMGIADGGIVWLIGWCGSVLEQIASLRDIGAEPIFQASELEPISTS